MGNMLKSSLILTLVAFLSSLALSHIDRITRPNIEKQEKEKQKAALALVLPGYEVGEDRKADIDGKEFLYWEGVKTEGDIVKKGYAFISANPGYSGDVESMVGIDEEGRILGISILKQTETPGLGARCEEVPSTLTLWGFFSGQKAPAEEQPPWFQEQFRGLNTAAKLFVLKLGDWNPSMRDELMEKNAISALTGATITSLAVKKSIEEGTARLNKALDLASSGEESR